VLITELGREQHRGNEQGLAFKVAQACIDQADASLVLQPIECSRRGIGIMSTTNTSIDVRVLTPLRQVSSTDRSGAREYRMRPLRSPPAVAKPPLRTPQQPEDRLG